MLCQLSYTHHPRPFNPPGAAGRRSRSCLRGAPEGIRTPDPRLRRPLLFPPELLARESGGADLNGRPPAPKAGALPSCATPRAFRKYHADDRLSTNAAALIDFTQQRTRARAHDAAFDQLRFLKI